MALTQIESSLTGFDQFIAEAAHAWRVPGVAVGIVKGKRCVYAHYHGLRDVERKRPVTRQTRFEIGSITKSFTATALGMLADEGKLDWDRPICEYLPRFALADPAVTAQVTVRDLLAHRTGMPRHDFAHFGSQASREGLVMRLRHLPLNAPFRVAFQYNNLQYVAAGWIVEQITGMTWEELLRRRIFAPLKLSSAAFLNELTGDAPHLARGYETYRKPVEASVPARHFLISAGPAGSITMTLGDLCRWVAFQMGRQRLLQEETRAALHAPAIVRSPSPDAEIINPAYGMGWQSMAYRGRLWVEHAGGTSGCCALAAFLPAEQLGVAVLTNGATHLLPMVLGFNAIERMLGLEPVDWLTRARRSERKREREQQAKRRQEPATSPASPTPELAAYAGDYRHPGYGSLTVRATDEAILIDFHRMTYTLQQTADGGYQIANPWDRRFPAALGRDEHGAPTIAIDFEPATAAIAFARV